MYISFSNRHPYVRYWNIKMLMSYGWSIEMAKLLVSKCDIYL